MSTTPQRGARSNAAAPRREHARGPETSEREQTRQLLRDYQKNRDPAIRDRLVELNSDLVHYIARRFANRGEPLEDIEQVGFVGLIQAIDRFDPSFEYEFSTFATPTIAGEIRRYFRDRSWAVRVPRRLQENYQKVTTAQQQLTQVLNRQPSVPEIAEYLGFDTDEVLSALEVSPAQRAISLEAPAGNADDATSGTLGDFVGQDDSDLERVEARELVQQAMAHLTPREREIMALRFVDELPQTEVAKRLGISQMHVSRIQRAAMEHLKKEFPDGV